MPDDFARYRDSYPVPCLVVVPVPRPGVRFEAVVDSSIPLLGVHSGHFVVLVERELSLAGISGVTTMTTDERTVGATVHDPEAKVAVIDWIREDGAVTLDVSIEESSLEDLFTLTQGRHRWESTPVRCRRPTQEIQWMPSQGRRHRVTSPGRWHDDLADDPAQGVHRRARLADALGDRRHHRAYDIAVGGALAVDPGDGTRRGSVHRRRLAVRGAAGGRS